MVFITACLLLAGCATEQPPPTANIPVGVTCLPPDYPKQKPTTVSNGELKAMDDQGLLLTIATERLELIGYAAKAEAVISACK